ncbi:MAG: type IV toxin-antitoxin system AbiEi family antitoxin domain-containing protein [Bradymonadia bacterium]
MAACVDSTSPHYALAARYLVERRVHGLASAIVRGLQVETGSRGSVGGVDLIEQLCRVGILRRLEGPSDCEIVYWLVPRGGDPRACNPLEVIAAFHPEAVAAGLTALDHHHVTQLRLTSHSLTVPRGALQRRRLVETGDHGARVMVAGGRPYFAREAKPDRLIGVEMKYTDSHERVRVFDLERALVDALFDPERSGGIRGVVEAWEAAADRVDSGVLVGYLEALDVTQSAAYWRRAGYLAERNDLTEIADAADRRWREAKGSRAAVALLPGGAGVRTEARWGLVLPW